MFVTSRLLAAGSRLVQHLCDLRRPCLFIKHYAHVLHLLGPVPWDKKPTKNPTHLLNQEARRLQDRPCLASLDARIKFNHGPWSVYCQEY